MLEVADIFRVHGPAWRQTVPPEPGTAEGHVGHRTVPHRGAGWTCVALRRLRKAGDLLQLVPQPPLPEVPGERRTPLARGTSGRPAAGGVLPRGLHAAGHDRRDRLVQQGGALRPAVRRRRRDPAYHRRRSEASGRADRRDAGAAHVGLGADPPSPCPRHRPRRRPVTRRRALGRLPARLLPAGARALAAVPAPLPRRTRSSCIVAAQLRFFGEYAALADPAAFARWLAPLRASASGCVYAKRPFAGPEAVLAYLSRYTHRVAISNQPARRDGRARRRPSAGRTTVRRGDPPQDHDARARTSSCAASCCTCCPAASTASATTACWPIPCAGRISRRCVGCCTSCPQPARNPTTPVPLCVPPSSAGTAARR